MATSVSLARCRNFNPAFLGHLPVTPPVDWERRNRLHLIDIYLRDMPESERTIIQARYLEGPDRPSQSELAARLGLSQQRIAQLERRAIQRLRELMAPHTVQQD